MLTVVGCLVEAHGLRLVARAAGIYGVSGLMTACMVGHVRRAGG